jgi:hypothetical protein
MPTITTAEQAVISRLNPRCFAFLGLDADIDTLPSIVRPILLPHNETTLVVPLDSTRTLSPDRSSTAVMNSTGSFDVTLSGSVEALHPADAGIARRATAAGCAAWTIDLIVLPPDLKLHTSPST